MARRKINYYKFTPGGAGAGTVKMPDAYSLDDILMITNVTRNVVIYNFGDPNRGAASLVFDDSIEDSTFNSGISGYYSAVYNGVTTLTLDFDTSTHSANDVLAIYVEDGEVRTRPFEFGLDAVERTRVAIPRSLIDADFEYGLQTTKWSGFTTYRQTPTTYFADGTDFSVNATSYVTLVTGEAAGPAGTLAANTERRYWVNNQGNVYLVQNTHQTPGAFGGGVAANAVYPLNGSQVVSTAAVHNLNEYKLVINQPPGAVAGQATGPANATYITNKRPITQANGGQFQRTFSVASTAQLAVNDVIAAIGLPRFDQVNSTTGATVLAAECPISMTARNAGGFTSNIATTITANSILAVEVGGIYSNQFELISVTTAVAGAQAISGVMNVLGTNAGNSFTSGGRVYCLTPGGWTTGNFPNSASSAVAAGTTGVIPTNGVVNSIELMRVDAIDSTNNEITVTRSWFNTNANVTFGPGTIISTVNLRQGQTYDQWLANCEILKVTNSSALNVITTANNAAFPTNGTGSQPITGIVSYTDQSFPFKGLGVPQVTYTGGVRAGSIMVTLSGMFQAGNTSIPLVGISANNSTITQYSTSNVGNCWVSTVGVTGAFQNANVEGVFMNQVRDQNYIFFYPKVSDASKYPGHPLIPPGELSIIAPRFKRGGLYQGANLLHNAGNVLITANTATNGFANILVRTQNPHGILPGTPIQIQVGNLIAGPGSTATQLFASGIFPVTHANLYYFSYITKGATGLSMGGVGSGTGPNQTGTLNSLMTANVYAFPTSLVKHRGLDGGTNIGINAPSWGFETTRQTRKYFRYQSGKGMMFTTGTQFNPVFSIANIQANSATLTAGGSNGIDIVTTTEHGLQRGANVKIYGIDTVGYNDYYKVDKVNGPYGFTVKIKTTLGSRYPVIQGSNISDYQYNPRVTVSNWWGAKVRSGMFDDGNGVFWEYDGQYLWAVKRSATYELPGTVTLASGDNRVVGDTNTRFKDNIRQGDQVQIRGMVFDIIHVESHAVMYVTPAYRGISNIVNAGYSVVREQRVRQALFNRDRLDGTGPSGYKADLGKMQMVGIQYTWYGAGFIDWGMRTKDGRMVWAHRVKNNNRNDEGYMRSGNLPARYQASNRGATTYLLTDINDTDTTLRVANIDEFPFSCTSDYPAFIMVDNEIMSVTSIARLNNDASMPQGTLTIGARAAEYTAVILNSARSMRGEVATAHSANTSPVMLYGVSASPDLNHWGSAVILDGDFDVDRTYSFTYSQNNITVNSAVGVPQTVFMIRLAPSLGSGVPADLGTRDLLNRAQLLLQNCYVNVGGSNIRCILQGLVNPVNVEYAQWQNVNTFSNQYAPSFAQFCSNVATIQTTPIAIGGAGTGTFNAGLNSHLTPIKWASYTTQPSGAFAVVQSGVWIVPYAFGGEQLFTIPVSSTNSGFIDLAKVKEVGGTIIPGNQVYPTGPEIIAFNIIPITTVGFQIDLQLTWIESQA